MSSEFVCGELARKVIKKAERRRVRELFVASVEVLEEF
jgi:hypothetical protein